MEEKEIRHRLRLRVRQLVHNLKPWRAGDVLLFFMVIPVFLCLVSLLPQQVKNEYFVFNTVFPSSIQTFILNEDTHSFVSHLSGNLVFYLAVMLAIFLFEDNRQRFMFMTSVAFVLVPVVASLLTLEFWNLLGRTTTSQGFSGINAALIAYFLMAYIMWAFHDFFPSFEHPDMSSCRKRVIYFIMMGLVGIVSAAVIYYGPQLGFFIGSGNAVSNGVAHFGGFITGLVMFLVYDLRSKQRNLAFDAIFCFAIIVAVALYVPYLMRILAAVQGS